MLKIRILVLVVLAAMWGSAPDVASAQAAGGRATVVWISIDGFRGDYLERGVTPTLSRLAKEGAFTNELVPVFPSVTFPNHVSQVTGTTVDGHGIVGNTFYDSLRKEFFKFPADGSLLRAEPIWVTAKRQGVRSAVSDWPVGQAQKGEFVSDYFNSKFDSKEGDRGRMMRLLKYYQEDTKDPPLRLLIGYLSRVDTAGHRWGPDSKQVNDALAEADGLIDEFLKAVTARFEAMPKNDETLYLIITADHGMCPVKASVHLQTLLGPELAKGAVILTDGPVADVWLNDVPEQEKDARSAAIVETLNSDPNVRAFRRGGLPEHWRNEDPTRSGDVFVVLPPGHTFTSRMPSTTQPASGPAGMHGYDPAVCPEMNGGAIIWRAGRPMGGKHLGRIDNTQWHATVARLLGIDPSPVADKRPIEVE